VQSVKSKLVEPGYGYVRVVQFQEQTAASLVQHLDKLVKQGEMKGLVLDLRNDPGGLLHGAVGVSAAFLPPKALVVSTDGRADDSKRKYLACPRTTCAVPATTSSATCRPPSRRCRWWCW
jgi:carboxyl-terminal processing protease